MSSTWSNIPAALQPSADRFAALLRDDEQLRRFTSSAAGIDEPLTFGIAAVGSDEVLLVSVGGGRVTLGTGVGGDATSTTTTTTPTPAFTLLASPQQWQRFFQSSPPSPHSLFHTALSSPPPTSETNPSATTTGNLLSAAQHTHIYRRVLELAHAAHCAAATPDAQPEPEPVPATAQQDHPTGHYLTLDAKPYGRTTLFYDVAGTGKQPLIFLHSAGADAREYHGVMRDSRLRKTCVVYAFDLPGHGRSAPAGLSLSSSSSVAKGSGGREHAGEGAVEDVYVGIVAAFVKALGLRRPIVCGAGMGAKGCLAVAARAREVGVLGAVVLTGPEHKGVERQRFHASPYVNQALFNPESVYGMMAPTTPLANKQLLWHIYSSQAYGILAADLDLLSASASASASSDSNNTTKVPGTDIASCPIYTLSGEYALTTNSTNNSANPPAPPASALHKTMPGLGFFPATENPGLFVPYLLEAVEYILGVRREGLSVMRLGDGTD